MIANSEKMKTKKSYPNFILSFKKGMGWGRKLLCFHRKIYLILVNFFCVFLLEHIDVFWMFLLLPAIKSKAKDRQSVTSSNWARLTNPWKLSNQIDLQDSSVYGNSKFYIHFFSLIFYKDVYLACAYIVSLADAKSFSSGTVLPLLLEVCNKIHDLKINQVSDVKVLRIRGLISEFFQAIIFHKIFETNSSFHVK